MILVTGATGNLGKAVVEHLLKQVEPSNIIAFGRNDEKLAELQAKGVQTRKGNFDDKASLEKAVEGVEKLLLIPSLDHAKLFDQNKSVVDIAKAAGVKHIVYVGMALKDHKASPLNTIMMDALFETEDYIRESGLGYTILRNTLYADAIPVFIGEKALEYGIHLPAADGKVAFALRREMGEAAANVLASTDHANKLYNITAEELYTYYDIAAALTELSGKEVIYTAIEQVDFENTLRQFGVPEYGISVVSGFIADQRNGNNEIKTTDLQMLLGRKPMTLMESLKEIYKF